jgi:NAD(P)-dependent dehydrogenase (short-subunit alcohol dehydrogenase family)/uncharacterized OB-fold protein
VKGLPPSQRSRIALGLTAAAAVGRFDLQVCRDCGAVQYPPREACHRCLSVRLAWKPQSGDGELLAVTTLFHSHNEFFRERLPWRVGMIRLEAGPTVIAHLHGDVPGAPARVRVGVRLDRAGQAALVAFPPEAIPATATEMTPSKADNKELREMTSDLASRKVLIVDGKTEVGMALARACVAAEAQTVWVGYAESRQTPALEALASSGRVILVPLDVTNEDSVRQAAAEVGAAVDVLISNAEFHGSDAIAGAHGVGAARAEMDVNYFGLLRLAQEFGPAMRSRTASVQPGVPAWVNLLSIYALANLPAAGTYCASKAAAYSLSQCLRAQMQPAGVRVVNVFPGPIDAESSRGVSLPKIGSVALARAIVKALQDGVEDVYPGEVATEWLARWRENPKGLERELAMSRQGESLG